MTMPDIEATSQPSPLYIRPLEPDDVAAVVALSDALIGLGYYDASQVHDLLRRATGPGGCLAFGAFAGHTLVGFRFTLPPGRWEKGRGAGLTVDRWPAPLSETGYFQSAFVAPSHRSAGLGRAMAERALAGLRDAGARAAVAHCWKESPGNSSMKYLLALGFVPVAEFPQYWAEVDYECTLDGWPCQCTAVEMVIRL